MSTLSYGHLARTNDAAEPARRAAKPSWLALLRLLVVLASACAGGVAAHLLLGDPGVQATVISSATGSAGAVVAMLTAYLFVRRMHRTLALADTLLGATLTLLPAVSAIAAILPALDPAAGRAFVQFVAATGAGLVATLGLVAAAAAQDRALRSAMATDRVYAAALLTGALVVAGAALLAEWSGVGVGPDGARPAVLGVVHLIGAVGAGAAAVVFFRGAAIGRDPVLPWIAVAAAIVAAAHLTDALALWSSSDTTCGRQPGSRRGLARPARRRDPRLRMGAPAQRRGRRARRAPSPRARAARRPRARARLHHDARAAGSPAIPEPSTSPRRPSARSRSRAPRSWRSRGRLTSRSSARSRWPRRASASARAST